MDNRMDRTRKRMYSRVTVWILVAFLMAACCGCGETDGDSDPYKEKTDAAVLAEYLYDNITFEDEMTKVDQDLALSLYDLEQDAVTDAVVYMSTGATAEEIAVFTVNGDEEALLVASSIELRIEDQKKGFENYVPEELTKLDNAIITQLDNAVVMIVCNSTEEAETAISSYIEAYLDTQDDQNTALE